ncbi:hypothetical protein OKA05_19445 [Luteolibacter arcticus]|uniref:Uncharacterized protein n=1 Tax=Luteolibacter arcticus TaxID=1581411 RepID=A0ABT3GMJ6_9BACT|nr:hypothetical protein [Luteolibacter arcticus]MCW1924749.1 hypothetical protein [Luteolibacter arcticus]
MQVTTIGSRRCATMPWSQSIHLVALTGWGKTATAKRPGPPASTGIS